VKLLDVQRAEAVALKKSLPDLPEMP
jgi:hypothetical protein